MRDLNLSLLWVGHCLSSIVLHPVFTNIIDIMSSNFTNIIKNNNFRKRKKKVTVVFKIADGGGQSVCNYMRKMSVLSPKFTLKCT